MGGLLVLVAAFATGTETQLSASVAGQAYDCGPAISASWLVSGTPDLTGPAATVDEQRVAAACSAVVGESRVLVLALVGAGSLLALVGWSAIRAPGDRRTSERRGGATHESSTPA